MKRMKFFSFLAVLCILILLSLAACSRPANEPKNIGSTQTVEPLDYKNGVYYFPVTRAKFANSLSAFIKRHSEELELSAMTGDGTEGQGTDSGYFAVFRKK